MTERMTWKEIQEKYPDQRVRLVKIYYSRQYFSVRYGGGNGVKQFTMQLLGLY